MNFSSHDQYHIGYTPWESTELPENWAVDLNQCNEVWAPAHWVANVYKVEGITRPIKVYPHGIDPKWKPRLRRPGVINFFHQGEPSPRKGGQMVVDAFVKAFQHRNDVHLTIKAHGMNTTRIYKGEHIVGAPDVVHKNITVIRRALEEDELIKLYHEMDVMVYPSWGEGFGLIPFQGIATGMPTICTAAWATFKDELLPDLRLSSRLVKSPWQRLHPGKQYKPDEEHLVELLQYASLNIEPLAERACEMGKVVHERYNWLKLTEEAFEPIVKKFG
jgi:glycosyltransferase involved in cell wall biosynthesis